MAQALSPDSQAPTSLLIGYLFTFPRECIARSLNEAGFEVVGHSGSMQELCDLAEQHQPDVVLLDWGLPDCDADSMHALGAAAPQAYIVILTRLQPPRTFLDMARTQVSGYLSMNSSLKEFSEAAHLIARGDVIVSREIASIIMQDVFAESEQGHEAVLSDRERAVVALLARGATNREIGEKLMISGSTVKVHLRHILHKLNLRNRQQAAAWGAREALTSETPRQEGGAPTP